MSLLDRALVMFAPNRRVPYLVIPAKAGIHFALALNRNAEIKVKMGPGFRRDDANK
jgi:hypothetical protein